VVLVNRQIPPGLAAALDGTKVKVSCLEDHLGEEATLEKLVAEVK